MEERADFLFVGVAELFVGEFEPAGGGVVGDDVE